MFLLKAKDITKSYPSSTMSGNPLPIINNFSFQVTEGELVTMFGPNGCGKTTILNILAGIMEPDSGKVIHTTNDRNSMSVGYVFQNYADTLLPWRTVKENISFPLEIRKISEEEITELTDKFIKQFRLTEHADKYVYELSGGLKQLVAIARATVYNPRLLLLDEPFSSLDYSLSRKLWLLFREFWTNLGVTTVFVSHNIDEAIFLGDRVCVLSSRPGRVIAEIPIPFGKNRDLHLLSSREFFSVRAQVLDGFDQGRI